MKWVKLPFNINVFLVSQLLTVWLPIAMLLGSSFSSFGT